ncbi:MAG TPA: hypothetical protein VK186_05190 [Candidatus Deferrimicrobium sp.]|nr:hypothetical protein [Candidatus Deferrimicrobium sp.]
MATLYQIKRKKARNTHLSDLIKETREYIKDRGIKRIKDGWQFPAAFRAATFLS